jgi:malate permease and related proteins
MQYRHVALVLWLALALGILAASLPGFVAGTTPAHFATAAIGDLLRPSPMTLTSVSLFGQLGLTVVVGFLARRALGAVRGGTAAVDQVRQQLNRVVLWVTLPVLVFDTVRRAPVGIDVVQIPMVAAIGMGGTAVAAWLLLVRLYGRTADTGGLVLAASAGSVSFLGIPIVRALFGPEEARIAVYFAVLNVPLALFSASLIRGGIDRSTRASGSMVGSLLSVGRQAGRQFFALPATWALIGGLMLHSVAMPASLESAMQVVSFSVAPTVMLALGMALRFDRSSAPYRMALPAVAIKLAISPLIVFACGSLLGLSGVPLAIVSLQGAMPTQVLSVVIAERYRLNARLVGLTLAMNTALAFVLLPMFAAVVHARIAG